MFVVLLVSVCWWASALGASAPYYKLEDAALHFEDFITKYDKQYVHEKEKEARFHIFVENLKDVNEKNNASKHTTYGITRFMDLTLEEFKTKYTGYKAPEGFKDVICKMMGDKDIHNNAFPTAYDWRDHGVVGPVKDQGQCGSCYSFSSSGHIESQYALKYGITLSLSEQQIIDCDRTNMGCDGGYMSGVYSSLIQMGGLEQEFDYPYQGGKGQCRFNKSEAVAVLTNCYQYQLSSLTYVKLLLFKAGPLSIAIDATPLHKYHGGIVHGAECTGEINHAVLLVGYGSEGGVPYWIVKNSWNAAWGEQGYFRMEAIDGVNSCGMLNDEMTLVELQ